ncbi:putative G-protein coupled receptor AH9.4 [Toxocara canis]|uniref:Putative G-protein coupled receptor AH9.4 n=1 Tax=Toxocara canis TaxID=6265 RepID=A0A0B2VH14_TOXCA|nr:putative G-protein coupled receptor AH9.4 [Toxocara canis]
MVSLYTFVLHVWYFLFSSLYFIVPVAGIALNGYVVFQLSKIARQNLVRFETSSGLPLFGMSVGDSICLFAQLSQAVFHFAVKAQYTDQYNTTMLDLFCKADLYLMHSTSAFSVWCWLLLSLLRYAAVFHPLKYRTIWRQPRYALLLIALACAILETWILAFVSYNSEYRSCSEDPDVSASSLQATHMTDITLSYVIPACLRIFLDGRVLIHCRNPFKYHRESLLFERRHAISVGSCQRYSNGYDAIRSATLTLTGSETSMRRRYSNYKKKNAVLIRSLVISAFNLICNLPSHMLRALWTLEIGQEVMSQEWMKYVEAGSQLLYFSQFTCNAFYLSTTIYETTLFSARPVLIATGNQSQGFCKSSAFSQQDVGNDDTTRQAESCSA